MKKLAGVITTASAVLIAVRDTESSTFALESEDMKLEMFPPGHEATSIIPSAIIGDIALPKPSARRKVNAGSSMNWQTIPRITDFGCLNTSANIFGLIPSATPYITKASTMFIVFIPPAFRLTWMLSIV